MFLTLPLLLPKTNGTTFTSKYLKYKSSAHNTSIVHINMKLRQPSQDRNKEFFILVQTLFNQNSYVVGSNLFNYYDTALLDDSNKCEKFRSTTARMNREGQSCFLDLIDTEQNQLIGCVGFVRVNRFDKEASLAMIFYQQHFDSLSWAIKFILTMLMNSKYNLKSLVCDASGYQLGQDVIDLLLSLKFNDITDRSSDPDEDVLWLRFINTSSSQKDEADREGASLQPGRINEVCRFWLRNNCRFGDKCRYQHSHQLSDASAAEPVAAPPAAARVTYPYYPQQGFPRPLPTVVMYPPMTPVGYMMPRQYSPTGAMSAAPAMYGASPLGAAAEVPAPNTSFSSYSTVAPDTGDGHEWSRQLTQSLDLSRASMLDELGGQRNRAGSEDSIATAHIYGQPQSQPPPSQALRPVQGFSALCGSFIDMASSAHPQWLFQLQFDTQFAVHVSPATTAATSLTNTPAGRHAGQAGPTSNSKDTPPAPQRLTAEDLAALDEYYGHLDQSTDSLPAAYHQAFALHTQDPSATSEGGDYALDTLHEATTEDFVAADRPTAEPGPFQESPQSYTQKLPDRIQRLQQIVFLIRRLQLDPVSASDNVVRALRAVLFDALQCGELGEWECALQNIAAPVPAGEEAAGSWAEHWQTAEEEDRHCDLVRTPSDDSHRTEPHSGASGMLRFFTQEMVNAALAERSRCGAFESVSHFLTVVGLSSSTASAESLIALNAEVAQSFSSIRANLMQQQQQYAQACSQYLRAQQAVQTQLIQQQQFLLQQRALVERQASQQGIQIQQQEEEEGQVQGYYQQEEEQLPEQPQYQLPIAAQQVQQPHYSMYTMPVQPQQSAVSPLFANTPQQQPSKPPPAMQEQHMPYPHAQQMPQAQWMQMLARQRLFLQQQQQLQFQQQAYVSSPTGALPPFRQAPAQPPYLAALHKGQCAAEAGKGSDGDRGQPAASTLGAASSLGQGGDVGGGKTGWAKQQPQTRKKGQQNHISR